MLVKNFTGVANIQDVEIQKPVAKLLIVKTGVADTILNEKVSIIYNDGNGNGKKITQTLKVRDLANISQFGAGYNLRQLTAVGNCKTVHQIDLTHGAAMPLSNNRNVKLSFDGLDPAATYSVYGLEVPFIDAKYNNYSQTIISGAESQTKSYTVGSDMHLLSIINNAGLASVRLKFTNGLECTYTREEAEALAREVNDIVEAADTMIEGDTLNQTTLAGGGEMLVFPLEVADGVRVYEFEISTTGTTDCRFITVTSEVI